MKKVDTIEGKGKGTYISGTGRFEGMNGNVEFEAKYLRLYAPSKGTRDDMIVKGVSMEPSANSRVCRIKDQR